MTTPIITALATERVYSTKHFGNIHVEISAEKNNNTREEWVISMKFDMYSLKARVLPALFSIIFPVIIFNHFYVSEQFSTFVGDVMGAKLASNITISTIFLFFLSEIGRLLGKNLFEKSYFNEEKHMPTTNFLMFSNSQYSKSSQSYYKKKYKMTLR